MITVPISLGERSYDIDIERNSLERAGVNIASLGSVSSVLLVTDETVDPLYGARVASSIADRGLNLCEIVIPAGEESKSINLAYSLWEQFLNAGADRKAVAVALGGGVVGDLTGFVAATYARGIRYYQIPTTLLAQVDSSVGGKTAIDLPTAKNMVGAFHQPSGVLIDPEVLATLSEEQYRSGLGEVVKYGASLSAGFFELLEKNTEKIKARNPEILGEIVAQCCAIKAQIVAEDEKETSGKRALLNYGHTFGHAVETSLGYGAVPHGHGVLVGSVMAAKLARNLKNSGDERFSQIDDAWIDRQLALYRALGLPSSVRELRETFADLPEISPERLVELMASDKKAEFGKLNFILPAELGVCIPAKNVPAEMALEVLREALSD